ncbi:MAG: porin [Elusimicrobiota bacterium]|jgi:hypothetical protein
MSIRALAVAFAVLAFLPPCLLSAQETPRAAEELTNALLKKGVLTEAEAKPLLELFARERQSSQHQFILLPGATMKVCGQGKFRYTFAQAPSPATNKNSFQLQTVRIKFSGDLPKDFKYALMLNFARAVGPAAQQSSALYDCTLSYAPNTAFNLTAGQFFVPVGGEAVAPASQIDFASRYYGQERILNPMAHDIGVQASGKALDQRFYYALGVFNGNGMNNAVNDNGDFLYAARTQWTDKTEFANKIASMTVGVNGFWKRTKTDPSTLRCDILAKTFSDAYDRYVYGADIAFKLGQAALKGEYLSAYLQGRHWDPVVRAHGYYATGSWRFSEKFEALVRWQGYDPDDSLTNRLDSQWQTYGVNWFINGQNARLTANYTVKNEKTDAIRNDEFILQFQLGF